MAAIRRARGVIDDINHMSYAVTGKFYHVAIALENGTKAYMLFGFDRTAMIPRTKEMPPGVLMPEQTDEIWSHHSFVGWSLEVKTVFWRGYHCVVDWGNLRPPPGQEISGELKSYLHDHSWRDNAWEEER